MRTVLLDTETWDCVLDVNGNIAVASNPYSLAQDAASAIRLFQNELWFDTTKGIPYWGQVLGKSPPPLSLMKQLFVNAAMTVPGVVAAQVFIASVSGRLVTGQVHVTDTAGRLSIAGF